MIETLKVRLREAWSKQKEASETEHDLRNQLQQLDVLNRNLVDEQTKRIALTLEVTELSNTIQENQKTQKQLLIEKDLQITSLKSELGR